jgi:hypothetical protein
MGTVRWYCMLTNSVLPRHNIQEAVDSGTVVGNIKQPVQNYRHVHFYTFLSPV